MRRERGEVKKIILTDPQRRALERLWFIYGNYGPKTTPGNHQFIQGFLECGQDERDFDIRPASRLRCAATGRSVNPSA